MTWVLFRKDAFFAIRGASKCTNFMTQLHIVKFSVGLVGGGVRAAMLLLLATLLHVGAKKTFDIFSSF